MGHKAAGTTRSSNNAFGPGTANEHTVLWWFKKFCKGNKSLEDEQHSGWPSKADSDKIESHHGSWPSHSCTRSSQGTRRHPFYYCLWHLKQSGKVKKLNKWVPHELTANQKNHYFEVSSLILCNDIKPVLVVCDVRWKVDFVQQPVMTSSVFGLRRSSEALPKARPVPKKIMVTCLVVFCPSVYTAFWIPVKPLHLRSMLSKSMRCAENCKACSWHWSTGRAQFFSTTMPDHIWYNQHLKNWMNWAVKFCLICHIHLTSHHLTATSWSILTTFCRENTSTTSQEAKSAFQEYAGKKVFIKSESTDFYAAGINKFIFHCQKCVDFNG